MPHSVKEQHLEDICGMCRKNHGGNIEIFHQHHKVYELITCQHCGYEMIKTKPEEVFNNKFEFM